MYVLRLAVIGKSLSYIWYGNKVIEYSDIHHLHRENLIGLSLILSNIR